MQSSNHINERKRNQRKSPLIQKSFKKEDTSPAAMRVGTRVKKAKIPFDPSPDAVSKKKIETLLQTTKKILTKKPTLTVQQNEYMCFHCKKNDKLEMLISCKGGCSTKVHLHCLQSNCEQFGKNEQNSWNCQKCRICNVCDKNSIDNDILLTCCICYTYFHTKCHGFIDDIQILKVNRFNCRYCVSDKYLKTPSTSKTVITRKNSTAKQLSMDSKFSKDTKVGFLGFNRNELVSSSEDNDDGDDDEDEDDNDDNDDDMSEPHNKHQRLSNRTNQRSGTTSDSQDDNIPDATEWSSDRVFKYFKQKFPKYAHVFQEHEIDGPSLYLLKRSDVVQGLNLKLGPALKIYSHILSLQTKSNDPTLAWN